MSLNLFSQKEVLAIIGRRDRRTLREWFTFRQWFPTPNIYGRPSRWTEEAIRDWVDGIPSLIEAGTGIPELGSAEGAIAYQEACLERLEQRKRVRKELGSIVRVFRTVPRSA